jgi:uncharacterized protein with GYD domain
MARYLIQASYTNEARAAMAANPQDREPGIRALMERLGGRLECLYFSLGDHDVLAITELPDDVTAVATALAVTAPGHLSDFKTTKLLTNDEMIEAMRKASGLAYAAPSQR